MHVPQQPPARRLALAIASILAVLVTCVLAQPAAASDLPPGGEQNRRAVYAGLFAMSAETHGALPGNSSSRRIPASSFSRLRAARSRASRSSSPRRNCCAAPPR